VIVKDFQKQLSIPKFQPQSADYYRKRKLYVNNFGIYCYNNATMNCYLWSEYDGQKTADEIISTLWVYFQKIQPIVQKKFIMWGITVVSKYLLENFEMELLVGKYWIFSKNCYQNICF
jgi:hypothetical protein